MGKWHPISERPTEAGLYAICNYDGTIEFAYHEPIFYYPFNHSPENWKKNTTGWVKIPDLTEEFADSAVVSAMKNGKAGYKIAHGNVKL